MFCLCSQVKMSRTNPRKKGFSFFLSAWEQRRQHRECKGAVTPASQEEPSAGSRRWRRGYRKDSHEHGAPVLVAQAGDTRVHDPILPKEEAIGHRQEEDRQDLNLLLFLLFLSSFRFIAKIKQKGQSSGNQAWAFILGFKNIPMCFLLPLKHSLPHH